MKILFPERTVRTEGQWLEKNNKEGVFPLYLSEKNLRQCIIMQTNQA